MGETLSRTTLKTLDVGDKVNIERPLKLGDEIGGHEVSGHVDSTAKIINVDKPDNNHVVTLSVPQTLMKYILPKGYISLDGCSLTIVDVVESIQ